MRNEAQKNKFLNEGEKTVNIITKPEIKEICNGEIQDFLLDLVEKELRNLPPDELSRRKELCQAILDRNRKVGNRDAMRSDLAAVMKSWNASNKQISALEHYGFQVIRNRTHFKVRWNESPYFKTLSCSPSDHRTGANSISELNRKFF